MNSCRLTLRLKSQQQGVTLMGRNTTGPPRAAPGKLCCIWAALQMMTDTSDCY